MKSKTGDTADWEEIAKMLEDRAGGELAASVPAVRGG